MCDNVRCETGEYLKDCVCTLCDSQPTRYDWFYFLFMTIVSSMTSLLTLFYYLYISSPVLTASKKKQ